MTKLPEKYSGYRPTQKLPEKLSDLIDLALADLRKVEKDDRYAVDMATWHEPPGASLDEEATRCHVCFAGAVMAGTLGTMPNVVVLPSDFTSMGDDPHTARRLLALDSVRNGFVEDALRELGAYSLPSDVEDHVDVPRYSTHNPEPFHAAMAELAERLRKEGY